MLASKFLGVLDLGIFHAGDGHGGLVYYKLGKQKGLSAVWISGNQGEALSDQDTVIFQNLVRNKAIHAFMEHARLNQLDFDAAAESVNAQFSIFLFENPGARQVWLQQEGFLEERFELSDSAGPAWKRSIQANLARLDRDAAK